jgi:hypothetical protein
MLRKAWRWIRQRFGFCSVCGRRFKRYYTRNLSTHGLLADKAKACPLGHEGFRDVFYGNGLARVWDVDVEIRDEKSAE